MTYVIPAQHDAAIPPVVMTTTNNNASSPVPNQGVPLVMNQGYYQQQQQITMKQPPLLSHSISNPTPPKRESDLGSEVSPLECGSIKPNPYYNPQLDPACLPFIPPREIYVRIQHETPDWLQLPDKLERTDDLYVAEADIIPELTVTYTEETDEITPPRIEGANGGGGVFSRRRSLMSPRSPKSPVPARTFLNKKKNIQHCRGQSCTDEFASTASVEEDRPTTILNLSPMTPSHQNKLRSHHRKARSTTAIGSFWGKHRSSMLLSPNPTMTTEGCTDSLIYDAPTLEDISPCSSLQRLDPIPAESPLMLPMFSNHGHKSNANPNPNKGDKLEFHPAAHGFLT